MREKISRKCARRFLENPRANNPCTVSPPPHHVATRPQVRAPYFFCFLTISLLTYQRSNGYPGLFWFPVFAVSVKKVRWPVSSPLRGLSPLLGLCACWGVHFRDSRHPQDCFQRLARFVPHFGSLSEGVPQSLRWPFYGSEGWELEWPVRGGHFCDFGSDPSIGLW
jgi:hypothetical protein